MIWVKGLFTRFGFSMSNGLLFFPFGRSIDLSVYNSGGFLVFSPHRLFSTPTIYTTTLLSHNPFTTMSLNAAATPFVSASPYEATTPYDVEQHLYDTPAAIAQDNEMAQQFLREHNAPDHVWNEAGHYNVLLDSLEQDREERIKKLEKRMDLMYVMFGAFDEEFTHFCNEHWKPFQAAVRQHCFCDWCGAARQPPVIPPPSAGSGYSSPSLPSLESRSSSSDGDEVLEEGAQESDDSYWTAVSAVEQGSPSEDEVTFRSVEIAGQVWLRLGTDGAGSGDDGDE
jgi:hypothetical protein